MNIYIGNLAYSVTEKQLSDLFEPYGPVKTAKIITDKFNGSSKGFGFVEIEDEEQAHAAIAALNGKDLGGRPIKVTEAKPRPERPAGGSRFGSGQGGHSSGGPRRFSNNNNRYR